MIEKRDGVGRVGVYRFDSIMLNGDHDKVQNQKVM